MVTESQENSRRKHEVQTLTKKYSSLPYLYLKNLHILSCKCFIEEAGIKSFTIQKNKPDWKNSLPTLQP
jgi:hypothetical protein